MDEKYFVGTKIISAVDGNRVETLGPSTGSRQVSARVYYPSREVNSTKVDLKKKAVGDMYDSVNPAADEKFPIIVYNHGYGTTVESNNSLCCELASQGYFVISVGHAYESAELVMESGAVIKADKTLSKRIMTPRIPAMAASVKLTKAKGTPVELYKQFLEFQKKYGSFFVDRLDDWAKDVVTIVEEVKQRYADNIELDRGIGITGHSFGGNVAYYMCQNYKGYNCGMNIDGALFGHYDDLIMTKPFFQICCEDNIPVVSRSLVVSEAPIYYAVFKKLTHAGFTDYKLLNRSNPIYGIMPSDTMSMNLNRFHVQFFNMYLKNSKEEILLPDDKYVSAKMVNKIKTF